MGWGCRLRRVRQGQWNGDVQGACQLFCWEFAGIGSKWGKWGCSSQHQGKPGLCTGKCQRGCHHAHGCDHGWESLLQPLASQHLYWWEKRWGCLSITGLFTMSSVIASISIPTRVLFVCLYFVFPPFTRAVLLTWVSSSDRFSAFLKLFPFCV